MSFLLHTSEVMLAQPSRDSGRRPAKPVERFERHQAVGDLAQHVRGDEAGQLMLLDPFHELGADGPEIGMVGEVLTLPRLKHVGFSVRRQPPRRAASYTGSLSVSSCEEVRACPALPVRSPGRLTTCQVVQVDGRAPGGSLATLAP